MLNTIFVNVPSFPLDALAFPLFDYVFAGVEELFSSSFGRVRLSSPPSTLSRPPRHDGPPLDLRPLLIFVFASFSVIGWLAFISIVILPRAVDAFPTLDAFAAH